MLIHTSICVIDYPKQKTPTGSENVGVLCMEGPLGLEPRTPCLKGRCSNQLSYGPTNRFRDLGIE